MVDYIWTTGRRKSASARIRLSAGTGAILINQRPLDKYFSNISDINRVVEPLKATSRLDKYDIYALVKGGGPTGQSGSLRHGIARALVKAESGLLAILKQNKFLTRDPRMKERKKYGLRGARRGQQYSKR